MDDFDFQKVVFSAMAELETQDEMIKLNKSIRDMGERINKLQLLENMSPNLVPDVIIQRRQELHDKSNEIFERRNRIIQQAVEQLYNTYKDKL